MNKNYISIIIKKMIQKELLNELERLGIIDYANTNIIIKKLNEDINKLNALQDKDVKNIIVKIPV